ncbi:unnamed protein product [Parnassius apollo]|uniref:(apollo) hypothetical protein n=1 Tax=Parnassius apollo TaxID=110799 RepID=A0A8S3X9H6_PARAO|nr:unnamed protein product [Parnassius apollo]
MSSKRRCVPECVEIEVTVQLDATVENLGIQECTLQDKYDKGNLPAECKKTAGVLIFIDNLFDSINGSFTKKKVFKTSPGTHKGNLPAECKKTAGVLVFIDNLILSMAASQKKGF